MFPDGLIAPIWIRKHRELIPCIFILVLRLWEPPSLSHPLGNGPAERPPAELEEERRQDAALAQEIIERKRTTSERGMKLAVIIMTSRRMLDDPSLDPRLGALRRASGLDSRSSLFVLSPLGLPEVTQFVGSLKSELWESALDFYREHSRRVRRKRGRPSVTASSSAYVAQNLSTGPTPTPPLSQQGWHARSDFKLATFAEIRQEIEVALKHYEDAWEDLSVMFGSTAILPPRTKRWAEAKVLIDCINIKVRLQSCLDRRFRLTYNSAVRYASCTCISTIPVVHFPAFNDTSPGSTIFAMAGVSAMRRSSSGHGSQSNIGFSATWLT